MAESLPGCFALQKPIWPNQCEKCEVAEECKKYVKKESLKIILEKIERIELILRE